MKAIVCGDLHFGTKTGTNFIEYQIDNFLKIIDHFLKSPIKNIFFMGDIFDSRQHIDIYVLTKVLKCFDILEQSDKKIYFLLGNHDTYYKSKNDINSLEILFKGYSFDIITTPQEKMIDNENCLMIPWINKENCTECLDAMQNSSANFLFGHFAIQDFYLVRGVKESNGLSQSLFKNFEKTYSGHFHLKGDENNISFVGSYIPLTWNDYGDTKRIIEIDTIKKSYDDVFLTNSIFKKVHINGKNFDIEKYKNKILKIYIEKKLSSKELSVVDALKENAFDCEVIDNNILFEEINENIKNEDFLELLDEVLDQQENIEITDRKKIKNYLKKLYDLTLRGKSS